VSSADLVLHVGLPHTGAPMLQRALGRLHDQLRARGVAYLGGESSTELPALIAAERATGGRAIRTMLISCADLAWTPALDDAGCEDRVGQVIAAARAQRTQIELHVQRQDRLLEFAYLHAIESGARHTFEEQFPDTADPVLDYARLVRRLAAIPRVTEVVVRPFEFVRAGAPSFVDDVLDSVGLKGAIDLRRLASKLPPYLVCSRQGLALAHVLNPLLETPDESERLRQFLIDTFGTSEYEDSRVIPDGLRASILDAYGEANRKFFRRHLPDLPEDSYADDVRTDLLAQTLPQVHLPPPSRDIARRARRRIRRVLSRA
jgi:hypothetical protein